MNSKLPMRLGVGIIVLNNKNEVFVGKRKDNPINKWQMPQGGIDDNEKPLDAMKRELIEETSIKKIEILKEIENWLEYELPPHLIGKIWKGKYRGQTQKWFIVRFTGNEKEINIKTKKPEFLDWKWVDLKEITKLVVDFKLHVYQEVQEKVKSILVNRS